MVWEGKTMSEENHPDLQRLQKACEELSEHFDSVQIFVTRLSDDQDDDGEGTVNVNWGSGNWFARYGQIHAWLVKQDEQSRKEQRE